MQFPILGLFIFILSLFSLLRKRSTRKQEEAEARFWSRELKANSVPDYTVKYLLGWHDKSMSATYYNHYTESYEKELCRCVNII